MCVAGVTKQQQSKKQRRVLVLVSGWEDSLHYLFHSLLEPIMSGFAKVLGFTYFSNTKTCLLIFSYRVDFQN